jgi:hypothetical protein
MGAKSGITLKERKKSSQNHRRAMGAYEVHVRLRAVWQ